MDFLQLLLNRLFQFTCAATLMPHPGRSIQGRKVSWYTRQSQGFPPCLSWNYRTRGVHVQMDPACCPLELPQHWICCSEYSIFQSGLGPLDAVWITETCGSQKPLAHTGASDVKICTLQMALLNARSLANKTLVLNDFFKSQQHHVCSESKPLVKDFLNVIDSFNLTQWATGPTHEKRHILDLVLTQGLDVCITETSGLCLPDHFPALFTLSLLFTLAHAVCSSMQKMGA